MKKRTLLLSLGLIFTIVLSGCNYPGRETPTSQVDAMNTAAAQTVQAQQTSIALTAQATKATEEPQFTLTATPEPGSEDETATSAPPTETLSPTNTPTRTPTPTSEVPCNQAAFVSETIPDGTDFAPGQEYTKTWTLRNSGSCTWDANYDVVFVEGDAMNALAAQPITKDTVEPGETVQISMDLKAPTAQGTHRGDFKLRDENGIIFGIGDKNNPFWVEIDVVTGEWEDFTEDYCSFGVTWKSGAGTLPCPGKTGDEEGFVRKIDTPTLENRAVDDEPGLQVHPEMVTDGWIKGIYPEIVVPEDVYFKAIIGCYGTSGCDVRFKLNYILDGGSEKTLATWHEVQDDQIRRVEVDLSSLAGENIQFILLVEANGSANNDLALWFGPRLEPKD